VKARSRTQGLITWDQTRCPLIRNEPLLVIVCTRNSSKMFDEYILRAVHHSFNGEANNFQMELFNDIHEGSGGC